MFDKYSPRSVGSDGNCLYRAASLACYGSENWHEYVRFRTAVQMLTNRPLYDIDSDEFVLKNEPMLTSSYVDLVRDVLKTSYDAEFVHVVALGAALKIAIQSYSCPLGFALNEMHPYTCTIINNQCTHAMQTGHVVLMWTKLHLKSKEPNHFVLLVPQHSITTITTNSSASGRNLRSRRVNHTNLQMPVPAISSSPAPVVLPRDSRSRTAKSAASQPPQPSSAQFQPPSATSISKPPSSATAAQKRVRQSHRSPTSQLLASTSTPPIVNGASQSPSTPKNTSPTPSLVVQQASRSLSPPSTLINSGGMSPSAIVETSASVSPPKKRNRRQTPAPSAILPVDSCSTSNDPIVEPNLSLNNTLNCDLPLNDVSTEYTILTEGTKRAKPKLIDYCGYTYNIIG